MSDVPLRTTARRRDRGEGPLRRFVATETSGAVVLLLATVAALVWANSPWGAGYEALWGVEAGLHVGPVDLDLSLRDWVNEGLMAVFFFVVGLEIRREFDVGDLRERRRLAAPVIAAVGGMIVPALIFVALNVGSDSVRGWGIVVGTDTAFALGVLSLSRGVSARARTFLLTLVVIDDVIALSVIALVYTETVSLVWMAAAVAAFGVLLVLRAIKVRSLPWYAGMAFIMWVAVAESGLHATVAGVVAGLLATAISPGREELRRAALWWRRFRTSPTPKLASRASLSMAWAVSPNDRLQRMFHPWSSYVIVPLFALANAGLIVDTSTLSRAATSPITLGIILGLVVGKVAGVVGSTWLTTRPALGGLPLAIRWSSLAGIGMVAGIGFTVSLLIADITFDGPQLEEAKIGILTGSTLAALLGWLLFRLLPLMPASVRTAGAARVAAPLVNLTVPPSADLDHWSGPQDAEAVILWYGDYQCPHSARAQVVIEEVHSKFPDRVGVVFRHLPLTDIHPHAQVAAEAAEAAAGQGQFWAMHTELFRHQASLTHSRIHHIATGLGLRPETLTAELDAGTHAARVERDVASAEASGAIGTPTVFVNGRRYGGPLEAASLTQTVTEALQLAEPPRSDRRPPRADPPGDAIADTNHPLGGES